MSSKYDIYIKHNLKTEDILNIDKIWSKNYKFCVVSFLEYIKNANIKIIRLDSYNKDIEKLHVRVYPYYLSEKESNNPIYSQYGYDFKSWILDIFDLNKHLEIGNSLFSIILSKSIIKVEVPRINLDIYSIHNNYRAYISMRKFVYSLVKMFNNSLDYKALYIADEESSLYIIEEMFEKNESFDILYKIALAYSHISAVKPPTFEEYKKTKDNFITREPVIIDDFRDLKD
jgi:hypothetical protein